MLLRITRALLLLALLTVFVLEVTANEDTTLEVLTVRVSVALVTWELVMVCSPLFPIFTSGHCRKTRYSNACPYRG